MKARVQLLLAANRKKPLNFAFEIQLNFRYVGFSCDKRLVPQSRVFVFCFVTSTLCDNTHCSSVLLRVGNICLKSLFIINSNGKYRMSHHQAYLQRKSIGGQITSQLKPHNEDLIIFYVIVRYYKYWGHINDIDTPVNSIIRHHHHHHHLPPWVRSINFSGIEVLTSLPRASTITSSSRFLVEGVFRESGVVHSFKMVDPVLFVFGSHVLYSRDLQFFSYNFASYFV